MVILFSEDELLNLNSTNVKEEIEKHKKTIMESDFDNSEKILIWDFYVSRYSDILSKNRMINSDKQLKNLLEIGNIHIFKTIRTKNINETLKKTDLFNSRISTDTPRIILMRNYNVKTDENENLSYSNGTDSENEMSCLLRHIRNSFAHNSTYFFENGTILLEDKDKSKCTARIFINKKTLLDWINRFSSELKETNNSDGGYIK